jgi:hypothetical protein
MNSILKLETPKSLLATQIDVWLIDGSGSMSENWWPTMAALDAYLQVLKDTNINSQIIAATFAREDHWLVERNHLVRDCPGFVDQPLRAYFSTTPLYDAINMMGRSLRDLDPPKATCMIVTDGGENASQYTNLDQAKAILNWMRAKGWQVIFFGCDFNNSAQAKALGANEDTAIGVGKMLLTDAARLLAKKRAIYGHGGDNIHFSPDEQQQFGGMLPPPAAGA